MGLFGGVLTCPTRAGLKTIRGTAIFYIATYLLITPRLNIQLHLDLIPIIMHPRVYLLDLTAYNHLIVYYFSSSPYMCMNQKGKRPRV